MKKLIAMLVLGMMLISFSISAFGHVKDNVNILTEKEIKQAMKDGQKDDAQDLQPYTLQMKSNYSNLRFTDDDSSSEGCSIVLWTAYQEIKERVAQSDPSCGEKFDLADAKSYYKNYDKSKIEFSLRLSGETEYFHRKVSIYIIQNSKVYYPSDFEIPMTANPSFDETFYFVSMQALFSVKDIDMTKVFYVVVCSPDVNHQAVYPVNIKNYK